MSKRGRKDKRRTGAVAPRPSTHHGRTDAATITGDGLHLQQSYYQGPLPAPEDLERFALIDPGAVPLILGNFNEQGIHRRALEQAVVQGSERRADRGQFIGALLLGAAIVGGCIVAAVGEATAGAAIACAALGAGSLVYVVGGRPSRDDG